ncbi:MAG: DUF6134 family protein [Geminicoccaceae bacterium]
MQRRPFLLAGSALLVAGTRPAIAAAWDDGWLFRATRNGSPIGWHRILLRRDGDRIDTEIEIDLAVKLAFVTLYSYRHRNREQWSGDRLVGFASETDDNGEPFRVEARAEGERIAVNGAAGTVEAPLGTAPTTWWSRRFVEPGRWIDTQKGGLLSSSVEAAGRDRIVAAGRMTEADRFVVSGDLDLELWYAGDRWAKLAFAASDGSRIEYELVATGPAAATAERA